MGADWNGDFLCWPFACDTTKAAERITEANRVAFLNTHYSCCSDFVCDCAECTLDIDFFEWDSDL